MKFLVFLLCAAVFLIVVLGGYVFFTACLRRKERPWLDEEAMRKTDIGKYYDYIAASNQWIREHHAEQIAATSGDGLILNALWIPAEHPVGTMVMAHGYRSSPLLDFGAAFEFYHSLGMNLLIPDQRAHGKSQGRYITFGVKESEDMQRWIAYHNENLGDVPILLTGISMGASTMMYLADQKLAENVRGLIVDCGFTSPREIISSVYRRVVHLPPGPVMWSAEVFARIFAGFSLYQKNTKQILTRNRYPILMVHGKEDGYVPCEMSEAGFAACIGEKSLFLVEGADHGLSFVMATEEYQKRIKAFIRKHVINTGERNQ